MKRPYPRAGPASAVSRPLVSPASAAALDREAAAAWGLSPFALVEAAGRACAAALESGPLRRKFPGGRVVVCAGNGNNGADALVMLRALLCAAPFRGNGWNIDGAAVLLAAFPGEAGQSPCSGALKALRALGAPVFAWSGAEAAGDLLRGAALIIDGIAGTGLRGALEGIPLEMVKAVNRRRQAAPPDCAVVSIDVPSGAGAGWKHGDALIRADYTLAVEPLKTVLYTPALRPRCGVIIPVTGIFPPPLLAPYRDAELLGWENARSLVPPVPPDAYKYSRGVAEIHAGSPGGAGAARIAAAGASAAGAGLVRLIVDDALYPVLASSAGGTMVVPASAAEPGRFSPHALLLGPGWGRGGGRLEALGKALEAEKAGLPLVLDADALALLPGDTVFHGRAILSPHAGELEALSGIDRARLLAEPALITELAGRFRGVILFKSHVMVLAGPEGRLGFIDGMDPALGAGGSGDLLAGFCAAIAARMKAAEDREHVPFDPFAAAAAAGTLLTAASRRYGWARRRGPVFYDPLELAETAAVLAGGAWLPASSYYI